MVYNNKTSFKNVCVSQENENKEGNSSNRPFLFANDFKPKVNAQIGSKAISVKDLTLNDLAKLSLFKFGSIKGFGQNIGVGRSRACQILKGVNPPKSSDLIKKISAALNIDAVVLAMVFDKEVKK